METGDGSGEGKGSIHYLDSKHFLLDLEIKTQEESRDYSVDAEFVADGRDLYVDFKVDGASQPPTPARVTLELVDKIVWGAGEPFGIPDISKLPELLGGHYNLSEPDESEKAIRYVLGSKKADIEGATAIVLELDKPSLFPRVVHATGDGLSIRFSVTSLGFPGSIDEGKFEFKAVEGQVIMDLTPMLQAQMGQSGAAGQEQGS